MSTRSVTLTDGRVLASEAGDAYWTSHAKCPACGQTFGGMDEADDPLRACVHNSPLCSSGHGSTRTIPCGTVYRVLNYGDESTGWLPVMSTVGQVAIPV